MIAFRIFHLKLYMINIISTSVYLANEFARSQENDVSPPESAGLESPQELEPSPLEE